MKSQCRIIAIVELILGVIGSFILAKGAGINVYAGGRNWTTTIFTFLIGVVVSYVSSSSFIPFLESWIIRNT